MAMNQGGKYEIPTEMRDFAERSVDQARKAFDGFLGAAQKAVGTVEESATNLHSNATDATRKTLTFAEQNIAAAFDHAQKIVRAKDLQEAMQLQTDFAKAQFAAMQSQLKELGDLAQSAARSATNQAAAAAGNVASTARNMSDQATTAFRQTANQAGQTDQR